MTPAQKADAACEGFAFLDKEYNQYGALLGPDYYKPVIEQAIYAPIKTACTKDSSGQYSFDPAKIVTMIDQATTGMVKLVAEVKNAGDTKTSP